MKWGDRCEHRSSWAVRPASPKALRAGLRPLVKFEEAKGCVAESEEGEVLKAWDTVLGNVVDVEIDKGLTDLISGGSLLDGFSGTVENLLHENVSGKLLAFHLFLEAPDDGVGELGLGASSSESSADLVSADLAVAVGVNILDETSDGTLDLLSKVLTEGSLAVLLKVDTEGGAGEESSSEEFHCVVV